MYIISSEIENLSDPPPSSREPPLSSITAKACQNLAYARFLTTDPHDDLGKGKFSRGKETSPSSLSIPEQPLSSSMELLFLFFIPIRLDYFPFIFYWIWKYFFEFYGCPQTILFLFQLDRMIANCFQFATLQSKEFLPLKMRYLVQV